MRFGATWRLDRRRCGSTSAGAATRSTGSGARTLRQILPFSAYPELEPEASGGRGAASVTDEARNIVDWAHFEKSRTELGGAFIRILTYFKEDGVKSVAQIEQ